METIILHEPVTVLLLLFRFFIHMKKYVNCSICAFTLHITTDVQTLCWSKTSPSFTGAHSSCISRSINAIFVPQIAMYIRIIMSRTDLIYLKIWCDSVTFCPRGILLRTLYCTKTFITCQTSHYPNVHVCHISNHIRALLYIGLFRTVFPPRGHSLFLHPLLKISKMT